MKTIISFFILFLMAMPAWCGDQYQFSRSTDGVTLVSIDTDGTLILSTKITGDGSSLTGIPSSATVAGKVAQSEFDTFASTTGLQLSQVAIDTTTLSGDVATNTAQLVTVAEDTTTIRALIPDVIVAFKDVNEEVTSSTTLQDDDELFASLKANTTYMIKGWIISHADANAPDLKIAFSAPTGSTATFSFRSNVNSASSIRSEVGLDAGYISNEIPRGSTVREMTIHGSVETDAAGVWTFRWSQFTSDGSATRILRTSWIKFEEKL